MRAMLLDLTKCVGCGACVEACRGRYTTLDTASAGGREVNFRRMCMHCLEPTCASACPVGALAKTPQGPVVYDASLCLGCRYCMLGCPFSIPRYEWQSRNPRVRKCDFCAERLAQGQPNACAEACPTGATLAGEREELLRVARTRLAEAPDQYVPHIYGEREAGGTSVLVLSPVPFEHLGLPANLTEEPLPWLTFRVLRRIPQVVGFGGALLAGLWWITNRRNEVAKEERS